MKILFIVPLVLLLTPQLLCQDTLLFMSGKEIPCLIIDDTGFDIRYEITKRNNSKKELSIHRSEIFSVTKAEIGESILYEKDDLLGDWLTIEEMQVYIAGEQDATRNYDVESTFWVGVRLGAIASYGAQGGLISSIGTPLLYTSFHLAPKIRIRGSTMRHPGYKYNEIYALGYERTARPKKIMAALKGSCLGMVIGYLSYLAVPWD
jgi:hypothetical protein